MFRKRLLQISDSRSGKKFLIRHAENGKPFPADASPVQEIGQKMNHIRPQNHIFRDFDRCKQNRCGGTRLQEGFIKQLRPFPGILHHVREPVLRPPVDIHQRRPRIMKQLQFIRVQGNRDCKGIDQPFFNHAANPLQSRPAVFPRSGNGEQLEVSGAAFLKKRIEPAANPVEIRVSEREYIIGKQPEIQKILLPPRLFRQICSAGTADFDQLFLLKHLQRLADRDRGDIEMSRQLADARQFHAVNGERNDLIADMKRNLLILIVHDFQS